MTKVRELKEKAIVILFAAFFLIGPIGCAGEAEEASKPAAEEKVGAETAPQEKKKKKRKGGIGAIGAQSDKPQMTDAQKESLKKARKKLGFVRAMSMGGAKGAKQQASSGKKKKGGGNFVGGLAGAGHSKKGKASKRGSKRGKKKSKKKNTKKRNTKRPRN